MPDKGKFVTLQVNKGKPLFLVLLFCYMHLHIVYENRNQENHLHWLVFLEELRVHRFKTSFYILFWY